jgi:hypothetical protein
VHECVLLRIGGEMAISSIFYKELYEIAIFPPLECMQNRQRFQIDIFVHNDPRPKPLSGAV